MIHQSFKATYTAIAIFSLFSSGAFAASPFSLRLPVSGLISATSDNSVATVDGPAALNFGAVSQGDSQISQTLAILNSGSSPLTISGLSGLPSGVSVSGNSCSSVPVGNSCSLSITLATLDATSFTDSVVSTVGASQNASFTLSGSVASLPGSCSEALAWAPGSPSGVYQLMPPGSSSNINAFCDMTTDGGGWTLIYQWTTSPSNVYQGDVMVRGSQLSGHSTSGAMPAYSGVHQFQTLRYNTQNADWNTLFGLTFANGLKFSTYESWPVITKKSQLLLGAKRVSDNLDLPSISLSSAAWWNTLMAISPVISPTGMYFGIWSQPNNQGGCGGENVVGTVKMCATLGTNTSINYHWDLTSTKQIWGR